MFQAIAHAQAANQYWQKLLLPSETVTNTVKHVHFVKSQDTCKLLTIQQLHNYVVSN